MNPNDYNNQPPAAQGQPPPQWGVPPAMPGQQPNPGQPYPQQAPPSYPVPQMQAMPPGAFPQQTQTGQPSVVQQQQSKPPVKSNPNSTQNLLGIAEIRDGIVIMNDGSFRAVVMVKSINFDLMSPDERNSVEFSYQGFLDSLYFPIQIFIRSQKVDIRPYLERLDKIRQEHENMLLAMLMEDYLGFIDQLSAQTNIMDKKSYIVIPYFAHTEAQKALSESKHFLSGLTGLFSNKEKHVVINEQELATGKDELRKRVQHVLDGLRQCSIPGLPLDTQELIELYYDTYNPDTATHQKLKNFDDLAAPVVTKGEGQARQPSLERELK